jgi:hypothetical protein
MTTETDNLIKSIQTAAKRHDDALVAYTQASERLFAEMKQAVDALHVPDSWARASFTQEWI